jgi:hypothetical protein
MFWSSVIQGIAAFFNWHIVVGTMGVVAVAVAVPLLAGLAGGKQDSAVRTSGGCLVLIIGGPVAQASAISGFVLLCLPAILGNGGFTPLAVIAAIWWPVLKTGLLVMGGIVLLSLVPILGHFIANTPGVPLFLQGIFLIRPLTEEIYLAATGKNLPSTVFPGFWACVGYVAIGVVICYALVIAGGFVEDQIKKRRNPLGYLYSNQELKTPFVFGLFFGPVVGVFPLLMYGRFVAQGIHAHVLG